jgi:hypothetical protein
MSPLRLFHDLVEREKRKTLAELHAETGAFFKDFDPTLKANLLPSQIANMVENAATALDIVQGSAAEPNEARVAVNSLMKTTLMYEAETKLKQAKDFTDESIARREEKEKFARAAAVAGALSNTTGVAGTGQQPPPQGQVPPQGQAQPPPQGQAQPPPQGQAQPPPQFPAKDWEFDMSGDNFDISFLPSDDPNCYKPLEIISYMGMTKNIPK